MTAAAIAGTFADLRTVKTRGICQLVIELPIEQADHALEMLGGVPQPGKEKWVGVARLQEPPRSVHVSSGEVGHTGPDLPTDHRGQAGDAGPLPASTAGALSQGTAEKRTPRKWSSMKWVERFGILCEDRDFIAWATHHSPEKRWDKQHIEEYEGSDEEWRAGFPATYVRWWCGVDSRTKIDGNPEAEKRAQVLLNEWEAYTGRGSARP